MPIVLSCFPNQDVFREFLPHFTCQKFMACVTLTNVDAAEIGSGIFFSLFSASQFLKHRAFVKLDLLWEGGCFLFVSFIYYSRMTFAAILFFAKECFSYSIFHILKTQFIENWGVMTRLPFLVSCPFPSHIKMSNHLHKCDVMCTTRLFSIVSWSWSVFEEDFFGCGCVLFGLASEKGIVKKPDDCIAHELWGHRLTFSLNRLQLFSEMRKFLSPPPTPSRINLAKLLV